ncbi:LysR family transcriptional regulator [Burkholderia diffusa]|uniref:LysR family transcriptional regulator n=1 Tax=Burkholderia diffusa TaxID=488732 RepID=UPI002ABD9E61|nr:LysR family transcriptional regulator [Burkholderia diffusa]
MRDIDLKTLRLFVAVCDSGNIARAAEEACIEPSAISKRIAQLESDFGVSLLIRRRRGVEATPAGMALLEQARGVLFSMERISTDLAAFGSGVRGHVSICASPSAIAEALLDDIASFMREPANSNVKVNVEEKLSVELVRQLREGATSIGVCWDSIDLQGLQMRPYRNDHLALAVHAEHPLAARRSISFEETLEYDYVGLPPTTSVHAMLQRAAASIEKSITYRVIVSSFDAAFRVVAAGLGISILPVEVAETYRRVLDVRIIPLTDTWANRRFIVCFKDFDSLQSAARRLVEYLYSRARPQS